MAHANIYCSCRSVPTPARSLDIARIHAGSSRWSGRAGVARSASGLASSGSATSGRITPAIMRREPGAKLVAVADADAARAAPVAQDHGAEAFRDHRALIGKVDAVSIAAPTSAHHAIARDLIDARHPCLHREADRRRRCGGRRSCRSRGRAAGVVLQVGHIERFSPAFQAPARAGTRRRGDRLRPPDARGTAARPMSTSSST